MMEIEILIILFCIVANIAAYYWDLFKNHRESDD